MEAMADHYFVIGGKPSVTSEGWGCNTAVNKHLKS